MIDPPHTTLVFSDGTSCWNQNLASSAWAIYLPSQMLLHSTAMCIGPTNNNHIEYTMVIEFLIDVTHVQIEHLKVHLDSQILIPRSDNKFVDNISNEVLYLHLSH